ncbi:hypothetical protein [Streptomyces sp. CNQ085]|uniref:hypothetical protein n=1 Tax=Streptomyces sp. CNQ085 TaxID=2886944 RepID=UPI001F51288C|nr:hypothetical protein [Streptomyces sp. CNQ085]MCI0384539.1 hypothetical protein [Streptomyces sp. CNQ085]
MTPATARAAVPSVGDRGSAPAGSLCRVLFPAFHEDLALSPRRLTAPARPQARPGVRARG